jgi:hypothetical protein
MKKLIVPKLLLQMEVSAQVHRTIIGIKSPQPRETRGVRLPNSPPIPGILKGHVKHIWTHGIGLSVHSKWYTIKGKCLFTIQLLSYGNGTYRIPVLLFTMYFCSFQNHILQAHDSFGAVIIFLMEQESGRTLNGFLANLMMAHVWEW